EAESAAVTLPHLQASHPAAPPPPRAGRARRRGAGAGPGGCPGRRRVLPHGLVGDQPVLPRELVGDGLVGDPALPRALVGELVRPRAVLRRRLAARGGEGGLRVRPGGRVLVGPGGHEGAAPAAQALRSMTAQASGVVRFPIPSSSYPPPPSCLPSSGRKGLMCGKLSRPSGGIQTGPRPPWVVGNSAIVAIFDGVLEVHRSDVYIVAIYF
ncbi:unnamed protein product, partial [Prorocentrum cordatum]